MSTASVISNNNSVWYVLRTMPQHEKKVAAYLKKKRIEHYLPLQKRKRQWSDRIKLIEFPVFPGYLFVRLDFARQGYEILQHHGTLSYLKQEEQPVGIAEEIIADIKAMIKAGIDIQADPIANFPPGEKVIVQTGPFRGQEAVVVEIKNKKKIYIKIDSMEQCISVDADSLEKNILE